MATLRGFGSYKLSFVTDFVCASAYTQHLSVVITYLEQLGSCMEQLWFSRGLVAPLILYGRVIFSRSSRALL